LFNQLNGQQVYARTFINNYAGKLTWNLNDKHKLETSLFGDPSKTNNSNYRPPSLATPLSADNNTAYQQVGLRHQKLGSPLPTAPCRRRGWSMPISSGTRTPSTKRRSSQSVPGDR